MHCMCVRLVYGSRLTFSVVPSLGCSSLVRILMQREKEEEGKKNVKGIWKSFLKGPFHQNHYFFAVL